MEKTPGRRNSILKKRRSRSLSPKPLSDVKPRLSRRISFSGKNTVREFLIGTENKETIWAASYEESVDNHTNSNEMATFASSTLQTTNWESFAMNIDRSSISIAGAANTYQRLSVIPPASVGQNVNESANISMDMDISIPLSDQPPTQPMGNTVKVADKVTNKQIEIGSQLITSGASKPILKIFSGLYAKNDEDERAPSQNHITQRPSLLKKGSTASHLPSLSANRRTINDPQPILCDKISKQSHRGTIYDQLDMDMSQPHAQRIPKTNSIVQAIKRNTNFQLKDMTMDGDRSLSVDMNKTNQNTLEMSVANQANPATVVWKSPNKRATKSTDRTVLFSNDTELFDTTKFGNTSDIHEHSQRVATSTKPNRMGDVTMENPNLSMDISGVWSQELRPRTQNIQKISAKLSNADKENDSELIELLNIEEKETHVGLSDDFMEEAVGTSTKLFDFKVSDKVSDFMEKLNSMEYSFDAKLPIKSIISSNQAKRQTIHDRQSMETSDNSMNISIADPPKKNSLGPGSQPPKQIKRLTTHDRQSMETSDNSMNISIADPPKKGSFGPGSQPPKQIKRLTTHDCQSMETSDNSMNISIADSPKKGSLGPGSHPLKQIKRLTTHDRQSMETSENSVNLSDPRPPRQTSFGNETIEISDSSTDYTANAPKRFNLNKTPYYLPDAKLSDMEISEDAATYSALEPNNSLQNRENQANDGIGTRRRTVIVHETIHGDAMNQASLKDLKRTTCYQQLSMEDGNDSHQIVAENVSPFKKNHETQNKNESMLLGDSLDDYKNRKLDSIYHLTMELDNESKIESSLDEKPSILSFIASDIEDDDDDDDDDDNVQNTKFDLVQSYDSDVNQEQSMNDVPRRVPSVGSARTSMVPFRLDPNEGSLLTQRDLTDDKILEISTEKMMREKWLDAFKKSNLIRRSGVCNENEIPPPLLDNTNSSFENAETAELKDNPATTEPKPPASKVQPSTVTEPQPSTSMQQEPVDFAVPQRSSIIRRSIKIDDSAHDETSFLLNITDDIPAREIKLDFSGYEKFKGLATIQDVLRNHRIRENEFQRQVEQWEYQVAHGLPLENFDEDEIDETESQNLEAPSWAFLFRNKYNYELEQIRQEVRQQYENRPVEAIFPPTPDISILLMNKCRQLKDWTFDDLYYFRGNIHLRNILLPAFKICILYHSGIDDIKKSVAECGAIKFVKIIHQFCVHYSCIPHPVLHLTMRELRTGLPSDLTVWCKTSADLGELDRLNGFCEDAQNKVKEIVELCKKIGALLKMENNIIFVKKTLINREKRSFQDYIIDLNMIDTISWRDVKTNPIRVLNPKVKKIPRGLPFLKEFMSNANEYIQTE